MPNFQYLRYFQVLAETEHFGRAAEALGIAQPSLSYAMQRLEEEVELPLFEKTGRNIRLTRQGAEYLRYVNQALSLLECGKDRSRQAEENTLRLGYISSVAEEVFSCVGDFRRQSGMEDVRILAYEGITDRLLDLLSQGKLDVVLGSAPGGDGDFSCIPWKRQELVVVSGSPLPEPELRPEELEGMPVVLHTPDSGMRRVTDRLFSRWGIVPRCTGEASEDRGVLALVKLGLGAALMTDSGEVRRSGLYLAPLLSEDRGRTVYLTVRRGQPPAPAVRKMLSLLTRRADSEPWHSTTPLST